MALTVGSLFSGIGGIDLGLERAGMVTRWFCEIDPHCRNVLARHWPGLPIFGDITAVDWSGVEPVDVLAGGFPCQPVSVAGRALAQADDRWLWPAFRDAIGALRPRYVLVENVPGLLQRGLGIVLGDLAEFGYDAEWECIPAAAVGAPHLRNRLWLIAYASGDQLRDEPRRGSGPSREAAPVPGDDGASGAVANAEGVQQLAGSKCTGTDASRHSRSRTLSGRSKARPLLADTEGERPSLGDAGARRWSPKESQRRGGASPDTNGARLSLARNTGTAGGSTRGIFTGPAPDRSGWWATEPDVGRVAHGVPHRVDRLRSLGNAVVPQVVEWIGRRIVAFDESREVSAA